jgi:hypothetical protein
MCMSWVKVQLTDTAVRMINFANLKHIEINGSNSAYSDLVYMDNSVVTIDCEFKILQAILLPILVKEDLAGNPL